MVEEWRSVQGYEGLYEVSNTGQVRSIPRSHTCGSFVRTVQGRVRVLRRMNRFTEHLGVQLSKEGQTKFCSVHVLVQTAFGGPKPAGAIVCHNNGNPTDNRADNLRWGSYSTNAFDAVEHGTHPETRKTHCPQGHAYDATNTTIRGRKRRCKTCHRDRERARRLSKITTRRQTTHR